MTLVEQITIWTPVAVPVVTTLIGLLLPSPGPAISRWSASRWAAIGEALATVFASKPAQAALATDLSPAALAAINAAISAALAAQAVASVTPVNPPITVLNVGNQNHA